MAQEKPAGPVPAMAIAACSRALALYQAGDYPAARAGFEHALQIAPGYPDAVHGMGVLELQAGRYAPAIQLISRAIESGKPAPVSWYYNLGGAYRKSGDLMRAAACYLVACEHGLDHPHALREMGSVLQTAARHAEAIQCFDKLVATEPDQATHYQLLGNAQSAAGDQEAAIQTCRAGLQRQPDSAPLLALLGRTLFIDQQEAEAIDVLSQAVYCHPDDLALRRCLAGHLASYGEIDAARSEYLRLLEHDNNDGTRVSIATLCPVIMPTAAAIMAWREELVRSLDKLQQLPLHIEDPVHTIEHTNFFLAYHGLDDAPLQRRIAALYTQACPALNFLATHCNDYRGPGGKLRIGLISRHFRGHSIGKTSVGLLRELPRAHFHVVALTFGAPTDLLGREICKAADEAVFLPASLEAAQQRIAGLHLDILFYQDIGMEPLTYFLSFARLAPVQCTSFGHPVTTGVPGIDYFISTEAWEPADADDHYTEQLVRLQDVASVAYYYPPVLPAQLRDRQHFGLDAAHHLYVCPQTLFKFHPGFDSILAGILRLDPLGEIVLFEGKPAHWADLLRARFRQTIPDVAARIRFLPRLPGDAFRNVIALADVVLDTIHFCGFNTTLEAFAAGVPVVTMPGKFMRSRHTAAFYQRMDIADCIAGNESEYIDIATRLCREPEFRNRVARQINQRCGRLWREQKVIEEYTRFFRSAAQYAATRTG